VASLPADGSSMTVDPGLNKAANQVDYQVAQWIGVLLMRATC
jgi:hypothetical protein